MEKKRNKDKRLKKWEWVAEQRWCPEKWEGGERI